MVDDLWSKEQWQIMRHCFPENDLGSRIIITTTNDALALWCSVGSSNCIYKIGLLSDADSEQLFVNEVFGKGQGFHQHFNSNSAEMSMKKCGGLPLGVRAATIAQHQSVHEWKRIGLKSLASSSDESYLWQRLNLTYNDLPNFLKTCMLYLSIFPEYHEVDVERLMRLWIAKGFVIQEIYRPMVETARSYLDGLISRNMVLPLHVNHHGIPKYCMVHPVIHDFIVHKSREDKFTAIKNDQHQGIANYGTIRWLSVQSNSKEDQKLAQNSSTDISHLCAIIVFGQASAAPQLIDPTVLRVLDLEGCEDTDIFLEVLHKLQLLKYLNLRGTNVSELPDTIGQLCFLQTLDVRSTNIKKLPPSIVMLKKLMHLLCGSTKLPPGFSEMKELQTLLCVITTESSTSIRDLSELVDLRELELFCDFIQMPQDGKQATFSHGGFGRLKKLCVRCDSASVVFEPNALPMVEVLELTFQGLVVDESSAVSGIEHLRSLNHVLLEFSQVDAGAMATVDTVKNAAATLHHNDPEVTVNVNGR
jgi:hypothetical protein